MLEEVSGTGMLLPLLKFVYTCAIFLIFVRRWKKNENRMCPLPYKEVLKDIIKTVLTEQCENLKKMRYPGKAAPVYPG